MPTRSFKHFSILLAAQAVSIFGTSLTGFALGVWVFKEIGSVTIFFLIALANGIPMVLLSPLAGAVVDRVSRKKVMLSAQVAAFTITGILLLLYSQQLLQPWHIIALVGINSVFLAFVWPAVNATIPLMVPAAKLTRANGMISMAFGMIHLTSPAISGTLYDKAGIQVILLIDLATYVFAFTTVLLMPIPQPSGMEKAASRATSIVQSMQEGWRYLIGNASLKYLTLFYSLVAGILISMGVMIQPMLLSITTPQTMGFILSAAGSGVFFGSLLMISLKNVNRHMPIILVATFCAGTACLLTPISKTPWVLALGGFLIMSCFPIFDANNRSLLQRKVDAEMLGRVIGLRNFTLGSARFAMMLVTGLLVDNLLEPSMLQGGSLVPLFGDIFGSGKGRGIALALSLFGSVILLLALLALWMRPLRQLDELLEDRAPDDTLPRPSPQPAMAPG